MVGAHRPRRKSYTRFHREKVARRQRVSPFAEHVTASPTYTDWGNGGTSGPLFIDEDHVRRFEDNRPFVVSDVYGPAVKLFARKFHGDSAPLLDRIDRELRNVGRA